MHIQTHSIIAFGCFPSACAEHRPFLLITHVNCPSSALPLAPGEYGVRVFERSQRRPILLPSQTWSIPPGWRAPGHEAARVVHAELLSSGDVVVVLYSPEDGLDLVVLPKEIFKPIEVTTNNAIIFPKVSVPWHPTVSTPAEDWTWPSDAEAVTPSGTGFSSAAPEKATLPEE